MTVTRPHRLSHLSHGSQHLSMPVAINLLETPFTGWLGSSAANELNSVELHVVLAIFRLHFAGHPACKKHVQLNTFDRLRDTWYRTCCHNDSTFTFHW